ncbi:hypothetical protein N9550_01020 [Planktomarina sp.]|nr:hypothetical protein [Planktomarina sp.]
MVAPQQATLAVNEYLKLNYAPFIYPGAQFTCRSMIHKISNFKQKEERTNGK